MIFAPESSSSSPCLMAGGAKVTECYLSKTSDDESGDEFGSSYVKLASLATKQQRALEKVQDMLDESDDMLVEEMDRTKTLTESLQRLHSKFDALQHEHNALLSDHEKLSSECLQRKRDLEKIRVDYEDRRKERDSLLAQQISSAQDGFEPPCLKCIERDNAISVAECSTAATISLSSTTDVVTNPSAEDTTTIADENARLNTLLETGMYKSLKGHQTLCDVLKRQILNRNPRKRVLGSKGK